MPEIGEISYVGQAGHIGHNKHIWQACLDCGKERWAKIGNRYCGSCSRKGERSACWKGGRTVPNGDYISVKLESDDFFYSMCNLRGYVFEHRLVMARSLGRCLQRWELVHHKGIRHTGIKNKQDNQLDNLELSCGLGEHISNHVKGYKDGYAKGLRDARVKIKSELAEEIKKGLEEEFIWGQVKVCDLEKGDIEWTMKCIKEEWWQAFWSKIIKEG